MCPELTVKPFPMVEHILNVLCHDGMNFRDVLCKFSHVSLRSGIQIELLGLLNECV